MEGVAVIGRAELIGIITQGEEGSSTRAVVLGTLPLMSNSTNWTKVRMREVWENTKARTEARARAGTR